MKFSGTALATMGVAFSALFAEGLGKVADADVSDIAMDVPSTTKGNEYGWLGELPEMREWIGDRVIHQMQAHGYAITNKDWELTVAVKRNDIDDDNLGVYAPRFRAMGRSTGAHKPKMVWAMLKAGFTTECYDGQNFFDTDHPVLDEDGEETTQSNFIDGAGPAWYLIDTDHEIKPIIFQNRKAPQFASLDSPTDENVFKRKEFLYGVDSRDNVGFGLWQLAQASKATLNEDNFAAAFEAMESRKGDHGRPLGLSPKVLVVPPSLRKAAQKVVMAETNAAGETNTWRDVVKVKVVAWLA